mgnify:CR=1 FL=1
MVSNAQGMHRTPNDVGARSVRPVTPLLRLMIAVALAAALVALMVGLPALKLSGHYLAMATLGFNYAVHIIFVQWDEVTGGPSGLSGIPAGMDTVADLGLIADGLRNWGYSQEDIDRVMQGNWLRILRRCLPVG